MRLRFNPERVLLLSIGLGAWLLWRWLERNVRLGGMRIPFSSNGDLHDVVVLAMLLITIVALFKLWTRR
jgi:hypothetical protein